MSGINGRRLIVGGLAAGLLANGFDFVITTYLMAAEFAEMTSRLNLGEPAPTWIGIFAAADFLWGFLLVFAYAAIRPRFGPGPRTALISGTMLWLAVAITMLILVALGLHTPLSYAKSAALYLVSALACSLLGATLYQE